MRKYITKSRSNHYTATVKDNGVTIFQQGKISSAGQANYIANQYIASQADA